MVTGPVREGVLSNLVRVIESIGLKGVTLIFRYCIVINDMNGSWTFKGH